MHTISSVVISLGRRLIISSQEIWWEFSKETSSQVSYISDMTNDIFMLTSDHICNHFFFFPTF